MPNRQTLVRPEEAALARKDRPFLHGPACCRKERAIPLQPAPFVPFPPPAHLPSIWFTTPSGERQSRRYKHARKSETSISSRHTKTLSLSPLLLSLSLSLSLCTPSPTSSSHPPHGTPPKGKTSNVIQVPRPKMLQSPAPSAPRQNARNHAPLLSCTTCWERRRGGEKDLGLRSRWK